MIVVVKTKAEEKGVIKKLNEIASEVCDNLCKYSAVWDGEEDEEALWKKCQKCPLNGLGI